jgi:4-hydroxy-4-methyl-2-oxoglutarate aldolase
MAIRRSGRPTANPRPPCPTARLCGTAVTVLLQPADNWMLHVPTRQLEPGDVVVAAWSTECEDGLFGELLATSMPARGGIGLVLDRCRYGAPEPMNFRVLAGRSTPRARSRSSWAGSARPPSAPTRSSTPATWSLGRRRTADIDGVVVVPAACAGDVAGSGPPSPRCARA